MKSLKKQLVETAFGQFRQFGFKNVTMDDLARAAGVSKKTLYEQFKDKDELVMESVKFMLHSNQMETDAAFRRAKDALDEIASVLGLMEKMIRGMNLVCYVDLQRHYAEAFRYLTEHKESYLFKCISDNILRGISEGLYREEIDVDIISRFRMESAVLVFQHNLFPPEQYDSVRVNKQIFEHYIYGLVTLKGHRMVKKYLSNPTFTK